MKTGEERLREAIRKQRQARTEDPTPYDDDWGWWITARVGRLENGQKWLIRLALGALAAQLFSSIITLLQ